MDGFLLVDKPAGWTSSDVVCRVRAVLFGRASRRRKASADDRVGHAGTLDPFATGLLVVGVGRATRLLELVTELPKEYRATVALGYQTDTLDADGSVQQTAAVPALSRQLIESALAAFVGDIDQVPPMFSAAHVDGKRLYQLARRGIEVERSPRTIRIHALALVDFDDNALTFLTRCSRGAYVRVLGADIARELGTCGTLTALRREAIGDLRADDAVPFGDFGKEGAFRDLEPDVLRARLLQSLLPMDAVLNHVPRLSVTAGDAERLCRGQAVRRLSEPEPAYAVTSAESWVRVYDPTGCLVALATTTNGSLHPVRVLQHSATEPAAPTAHDDLRRTH
ncbi:MAG: tRNA pseudouridine(55) synthase TruB [Candidatus Schekmanbacteria bacterium]|nr:tRNA pseudouridine(55) synthase TruB [Candidatus Schekmanbacteria bacterium]